jgi:sensor histidine kinase regulating citrate/malate metabolism
MYSELYFVGSRIEVVRDYCDPALKVVCYRDLLITVFCAYLDNAYEALLKTEGQRRIEISTAVAGDFFHCSIADSGCGFQDKPAIAAQPMLLYSGYTSKGGEGHGVGLTIVREIIEDVEFHNGQLDVPASKPGRTTFGFAIPLESTRAVHVRT